MPSFGLPTTAGTIGLKGLETKEDAAIPIILRNAGAILIATSNLSVLGTPHNLFAVILKFSRSWAMRKATT